MNRYFIFLLVIIISPLAIAEPEKYHDDISLDEYLQALDRLAPSTREGAEAYMHAFQRRCGRPITTIELRRAIADGDGDQVLMGMIRASYQKDAALLQKLSTSVACSRRG